MLALSNVRSKVESLVLADISTVAAGEAVSVVAECGIVDETVIFVIVTVVMVLKELVDTDELFGLHVILKVLHVAFGDFQLLRCKVAIFLLVLLVELDYDLLQLLFIELDI